MTDPWSWLWSATLLTGLVYAVVRLCEVTFGRRIPAVVRMAGYALVFFRLLTPATATHSAAVLPKEVLAVSVTTAEAVSTDSSVSHELKATSNSGRPLPWTQTLYGAGVLVVLGTAVVGRRRERSLLRTSTREMGTDGAPVWVHPTAGPCVVGTFRPRIVVPVEFRELPHSVRLCILAHERAHVRGRDPWIMAALQVAVAVSWPVVPCWLAAARIRALLEVRADATAVRTLDSNATLYGRALIGMASVRPLGSLPGLSGYRALAERIAAVAAGPSSPRGSGGLLLGLSVAALACSVQAESYPAVEASAVSPAEPLPVSARPSGLVQVQGSDVLRVAHPELAWATPAVARELADLAARLRLSSPGAILTVGDLSRRGGGRFPPHKSHRDGREVDLPWPVDEDGQLLAPQAWELLQALAESGSVEAIVIDGELHEGIREAAIADGATAEALAALLPEPSEDPTHRSRHVHVRFRAGGAS
ncbi:MAG: M56 family metallopeptidase [Nannocystales bacterium]